MKFNYSSAIMAAIAAIIIFCVIAVVFNVMPVDALPVNFIGATLGALIGALITLVLLRGQTAIEEQKGKDIRILEKKTEIFQDFIKTVWKIWEDQIITIEEFQNLTSKYYQNLMIYLKDDPLKNVGNALTAMGGKIDKKTYDDTCQLRENIVKIINTLSAEIDLGGKIDTTIMDQHDKIVFPILFRKMLLETLDEALNTGDNSSSFRKGKYESIWEGGLCEFIVFELRKFPDIKLTIGEIGDQNLVMVFMADLAIQQLNEFRHKGKYSKRFGQQKSVNEPIPDDEDKTKTPVLNFSKEDSMEVFRTGKRNFPTTLAKRVLYHLNAWNIEGCGIIEFLEKQQIDQGQPR